MTAYFHNQLEVEAYTVQAEAALKKLEEYNKRHRRKLINKYKNLCQNKKNVV
ncbi:MAG: hypothetical protein L6V95_06020 [Candidatus Melainabacteria bacterium]|nr:MAG: hypothetical protein L6V95_06020 [Candidatus Melainabacteria bacterium]